MSFRGDDQRRYGHVPPVQYPVAGHQQPPQQAPPPPPPAQPQYAVGRRPSFNSGDDSTYYNHAQGSQGYGSTPGTEDELFLASPTATSPARPHANSTESALSGYQPRYQDPATPPTPSHATYNPQSFARQHSTAGFQRTHSTASSISYHPGTPSRYPSATNAYAAPPPANYTPQTYNPAQFASAALPQRQSTVSHGQHDSALGIAFSPTPGATFPTSFSQPSLSPGLAGFQPAQPSPSFPAYATMPAAPTYDPSNFTSPQYGSFRTNGGSPLPTPYPPSGSSTAPYPTSSQIPVGPHYSASYDSAPYQTRTSRSDSQTSPHSTPVLTQSSPGLQRHPTNAPLPSRPPEEPAAATWGSQPRQYSSSYDQEHARQESIMQEIEAELGAVGYRSGSRTSANGQIKNDEYGAPQRNVSTSTTLPSGASHTSPSRTTLRSSFDDSDDDDPEGTAGVLAMQQAELDEQRFSTNPFPYNDLPVRSNRLPETPEEQTHSDGSDYGEGGTVDLGMLSGGYAGNLTYGNDMASTPGSATLTDATRSPGYLNGPRGRQGSVPVYQNAEVDYGGTGGLQAPTAQRLSFDEGEEGASLRSLPNGAESPTKDAQSDDVFYQPNQSRRPLPPIPPPPGSDSSSMRSNYPPRSHSYSQSIGSEGRDHGRQTPDAHYSTASTPSGHPERSVSLSGHSNTPQVQAPARSITDAAVERRKNHRHQQVVNTQVPPFSDYPSGVVSGTMSAFDGITLPTGRKKLFTPAKLNASDFRRCAEPWALSSIESWIREMAEEESDLRPKNVEDALIALFTFKVPTMNVADAEALSSYVANSMLQARVLIPDEEWVKFGSGHLVGVLWQLAGSGCYSPKVHDQEEASGRCYSHHCSRTIKRVDLDELELAQPSNSWNGFYGLVAADWESRPKKEVERQHILHEIVTGEENYIKQLEIFRTLYRDDLRARNPPVLHPDRRDKFLLQVFGKLDTVVRVNRENLLAQLKYRQQEQGPWITGFSDIFREWIRKAKVDYVAYAVDYPRSAYMIRRELERNLLFKRFLEEQRKHKSALKQDWTHFLLFPIQRLQRYVLLLETIEKTMLGDSEEKTNLVKAIAEVKEVASECDSRVNDSTNKVKMMELDKTLVLRPGFQSVLNLDQAGRKLLMEGDLQRVGNKGVSWVDTHALLFDHYFILAKSITLRDGRGEQKFDVSKEPIPMPLLFIESRDDEPVTKQKSLTAPLRGAAAAAETSRPPLGHADTGGSFGSGIDGENKLYPFKIKHLGHEVYTLYAPSIKTRNDWCDCLITAKEAHAQGLHAQNAEPFRLRVLADTAFQYDSGSVHARTAGVPVKGTPLNRAIQEIDALFPPRPHQIPPPVCRAQVNCAVGFTAFGNQMIAIGTDYGVYISSPNNPRGWSRTVPALRVTQIAVLEDFSVCILISDKSLISYPLDVIAPVSNFAPPTGDNPRRAPQRLAKDVTYFAIAKMKERILVFYKRRENLHTSFKVLEPVLHRATEKKSRVFGGRRTVTGNTESFRDYDEFFFPTECYSLSLFSMYIAVATSRGIEMLTLDKKQPMSIPDLRTPAIANIAGRIREQRPLGMFRLNENEFILTYEDCAVYVDKHGEVSRTLIMEYTGKQKKARGATMYGQYLILFNEDYVEVRNADNGRLRQIIAGKDVRVLDLGLRGPTGGQATQQTNGYSTSKFDTIHKETVKIAMSHPEIQGRQLVLEMLLNDGHTEN